MKVTLAMIKPSNWTGRRIQVVRFPFVIGREPGCDLRKRGELHFRCRGANR